MREKLPLENNLRYSIAEIFGIWIQNNIPEDVFFYEHWQTFRNTSYIDEKANETPRGNYTFCVNFISVIRRRRSFLRSPAFDILFIKFSQKGQSKIVLCSTLGSQTASRTRMTFYFVLVMIFQNVKISPRVRANIRRNVYVNSEEIAFNIRRRVAK